MHDMIMDQPSALHATLETCKENSQDLSSFWQGTTKFVLTGCGTSYHAALASLYMMYSLLQNTDATAVQAFELKHYYNLLKPTSLLMAFSHTGFTKTTLDAVTRAKESGARSFSITGVPNTPIAKQSDKHVIVGNGKEKSRAHTVSYTCAVLAAMYLSAYYSVSQSSSSIAEGLLAEFNDVPQTILSTLSHCEKQAAELAKTFSKVRQFFFLGAGPNVATAHEASLKMKETNYAAAEGMELEQFLHGPWVSLKPDSTVFLAATKGPSSARSQDLLRACKGLSVPTVVISDDRRLVELADHSIFMPDVSEELSPLIYIVPLQLFSYYVSLSKGLNPDMIHYDDPKVWAGRQIIFPPGTH